jgi:hypothetical protein
VEEIVHVVSPDAAQITVSGEPTIAEQTTLDQGVFVEVLDKHDNVVHRARYEALPIVIGNNYRCDHIVDGVDGETGVTQQVKIVRDEQGLLRAQSPMRFWAPGGMTLDWPIDPDRAFLVAGERVRIRTRDYAPSRNAQSLDTIRRLGGWTSLASVFAALAYTALMGWVGDIEGESVSKYVMGALATFGLLAIWAGIWAIVSRLNAKSSHFLAHLSLAGLAAVAIGLIDFAFDSAAFAFDLSTLQRYSYVLFAICIAVLVWCHTRYIVRTRFTSALVAAFSFGLAVFAMQATSNYTLRGSLATGLTMNEMRPPAWRLSSGASIEEFLSSAAALEKQAEASKPEKPEGIDFSQYGE